MSLTVLDPGFQTSVQDLGRAGYERFGVPVSGAMDRFALMAANHLVGNPPGAAALEALGQGPTLQAQADCLLAAAGVGFALEVDGRAYPPWMSVLARRGARVHLSGAGRWGYLAVAGGIDVPPLMGSRSTWLKGGIGGFEGRALQNGDRLPLGSPRLEIPLHFLAGRSLPAQYRPFYSPEPLLEVILGPQQAAFTEKGLQTFLDSAYDVTLASDRMGCRLAGAPVEHSGAADLLSEGTVLGAVQVPADGQPIVLLADRQTTGGYTKIAVVASADLPLLVQCQPGSAQVRFRATRLEAAQTRWKRLIQGIIEGVPSDEDMED